MLCVILDIGNWSFNFLYVVGGWRAVGWEGKNGWYIRPCDDASQLYTHTACVAGLKKWIQLTKRLFGYYFFRIGRKNLKKAFNKQLACNGGKFEFGNISLGFYLKKDLKMFPKPINVDLIKRYLSQMPWNFKACLSCPSINQLSFTQKHFLLHSNF